MILIVVGQTVVHVHLALEVAVQSKVDLAGAGRVLCHVDELRALFHRSSNGLAHRVINDDLTHLVAEVQQTDAHRDEQDSDDKERWQDRASS